MIDAKQITQPDPFAEFTYEAEEVPQPPSEHTVDLGGFTFDHEDTLLNLAEFVFEYDEAKVVDTKEKLLIPPAPVAQWQGVDDKERHIVEKITSELAKLPEAMRRPGILNQPKMRAAIEAMAEEFNEASAAVAPLWSDLTARNGRNPVDFIRDEYFTKGGMTPETLPRSALTKIDFDLSKAYASYIRADRNPGSAIWSSDNGQGENRKNRAPMTPEERKVRNNGYQSKFRKKTSLRS